MSVVVWDGNQLAADKRCNSEGVGFVTSKAFGFGGYLAAYVGDSAFGEQILAWFRDGHDPDAFPESQRSKDDWAELLIVWPSGEMWSYEKTPYPIKFPPQKYAMGSGRDFALAAMHLGKTAQEAVEVACIFDSGCGNGVDVFTHQQATEVV